MISTAFAAAYQNSEVSPLIWTGVLVLGHLLVPYMRPSKKLTWKLVDQFHQAVAMPRSAIIEPEAAYWITCGDYGTIESYLAGRKGAVGLPEAMKNFNAFRRKYESDSTVDRHYDVTITSDTPYYDQVLMEVAAAECGHRPIHYSDRGPLSDNLWRNITGFNDEQQLVGQLRSDIGLPPLPVAFKTARRAALDALNKPFNDKGHHALEGAYRCAAVCLLLINGHLKGVGDSIATSMLKLVWIGLVVVGHRFPTWGATTLFLVTAVLFYVRHFRPARTPYFDPVDAAALGLYRGTGGFPVVDHSVDPADRELAEKVLRETNCDVMLNGKPRTVHTEASAASVKPIPQKGPVSHAD